MEKFCLSHEGKLYLSVDSSSVKTNVHHLLNYNALIGRKMRILLCLGSNLLFFFNFEGNKLTVLAKTILLFYENTILQIIQNKIKIKMHAKTCDLTNYACLNKSVC